jgi:hypothetical protein
MPPRYAYWTILVDDQPTAFRSALQEDLMPTFKRLKQKHPSATMKWFQSGKLWDSRLDAQEAMRERGDRGRMGDARQGGFRSQDRGPRTSRPRDFNTSRSARPDFTAKPHAPSPKPPEKLDWKPKGAFTPAPKRSDRPAGSFDRDRKPEWKPKGAFTPAPSRTDRPARSFDRERKPEWQPKGTVDRERKPEWKPKGTFDRERKPEWKSKGTFDRERKPEWKPKGASDRARKTDWKAREPGGERPAWKPKSQAPSPKPPEKRQWVPKEEYKKSKGIERPRDGKWRPGGEHRDPKQKYKDAKKAKWASFKKNIRQRWETKPKKKS